MLRVSQENILLFSESNVWEMLDKLLEKGLTKLQSQSILNKLKEPMTPNTVSIIGSSVIL